MFAYKDISLVEAMAHIDEHTKGNEDWETTIGAFISGMSSPKQVKTKEGLITISREGFHQLVNERLGYSAGAFDSPNLKESTKLAMLYDLAESKKDEEIKVRLTQSKSGLIADAILSEKYSIFDSKNLVAMLPQLQYQGVLPPTTRVMNLAISPGGRYLDMRLIAPEHWDIITQEYGRESRFMGNVLIRNDGRGKGKLEVRSALTRHLCMNSLIGQILFSLIHKYASAQEFYDTLSKGFGLIHEYTRTMMDDLDSFRNIRTESPLLIFQKMGENLGIPQYALGKAEENWRGEFNEEPTLYHIIESVVRATQDITTPPSKNTTTEAMVKRWELRARIEQEIWDEAVLIRQMVQENQGFDHYLVCSSCHQRLQSPSIEGEVIHL